MAHVSTLAAGTEERAMGLILLPFLVALLTTPYRSPSNPAVSLQPTLRTKRLRLPPIGGGANPPQYWYSRPDGWTLGTASAAFWGLVGCGGSTSTSTDGAIRAPAASAGSASALSVVLSTNPGTGKSYRFQLVLNGTPSTTIDVTISDAATTGSVAGSVAIAAGDLVSCKVTPSGTPSAASAHVVFEFTPTTTDAYCYPVNSQQADAGAPRFHPLLAASQSLTSNSSSTLNNRSICPLAGTLKTFYVNLATAPGTGGSGKSWDLIVEQNGSEVASTAINVSETATTGNVTGLSVSIAVGDQLAFKVKARNNTATTTTFAWGVAITPTVANTFLLSASSTITGVSTAADSYFGVPGVDGSAGNNLVDSSTEATVQQLTRTQTINLTGMAVAIAAVPGSSPRSWTFTSRVGGNPGNLTFTIGTGVTSGSDTSHTDSSIAVGTAIDILVHPSATAPSSMNAHSMAFAATAAIATETGTIASTLAILTSSLTGTEEETGTLSSSLAIVEADLLRQQIGGTLGGSLINLSASLAGTEQENGALAATLALVAATMTAVGPMDNGNMTGTLRALVFIGYGPARDRSFSRPTSPTRPNVFVRSAWPPFPVIAELTTANNVNASWVRMDAGQARLYIHESDPQLRAGILRPGNLLSIEYPSLPVWAGPLRNWPHRLSSGEWELNISDLVSILDNRDMPQDAVVSAPIGWDQRVRNALTQANARALTGVFLPSVLEIGPQIDDMQEGGQSLKAFLDQGHNETDYEWWLDIEADRAHLKAELHIGFHQGDDLAARLHLWEGRHFSEVEYKPDFTQIKQAMTMYGDFGALLRERQTVARVGPGGPHDLSNITESLAPLSLDSLETLPPGVRNEKTEFNVMTGNDRQLSRTAARAIERPLLAAEQFTFTANRLFDWTYARVGNRLTTHTAHGFTNLVRTPRIVGVQVDFDRGEIVLATEVG